VPTALKKTLFNDKAQKNFKYASACNYIKYSSSQYLKVTKLKLNLMYEVRGSRDGIDEDSSLIGYEEV